MARLKKAFSLFLLELFAGGALLGIQVPPSFAFDYLEHSFFTDRACKEAQERLSARLQGPLRDSKTVAHYLALALACPNRWDTPYCSKSNKMVEGNLNRLRDLPGAGGGHSVTLGDFSALADHLIEFGPVRGLAKAEEDGLLGRVIRWISSGPHRGARGVVGSIGGSACATDDGLVPWARIEENLARELALQESRPGFSQLPTQSLFPTARTELPKGPTDPAGVFSFKNPQFLDMVLNSSHHFGQDAYSTWLGYHTTGIALARGKCEDWVQLNSSELADIGEGLAAFANVPWKSLSPSELATIGCAAFSERIRHRLLEWSDRAPKKITQPVETELAALRKQTLFENPRPMGELVAPPLLSQTTSALMGLVFEGTGLHFLQDGLSGGHIRTIQAKRLSERRAEHDIDNRDGVVAIVRSAEAEHTLIAYGDTYLLGPDPQKEIGACHWGDLERQSQASGLDPTRNSTCLVRHQRGVLIATTVASLTDWSLGGLLFADQDREICSKSTSEKPVDRDRDFVCRVLPVTAPRAPGFEAQGWRSTATTGSSSQLELRQSSPRQQQARLIPGVLPIPQAPYTYESLAVNLAIDPDGKGNQIGLDVALFSRLGSRAGWLTSHRIGLRLLGGTEERNRFTADYAFGFHFRWAARFLLDGEPFVFFGARNLGYNREFIMGIGPRIGLTLLPEGWTKIPFELSLSFRMPMTLFASKAGFFGNAFEVEAPWVQFGIGLAFM